MPKICQIQNNCSRNAMVCMEQIYRKKRWAADLLCCLFIWLYVFQLLTNNDEVRVQSTIYVRSRRKSAMLSERSFILLYACYGADTDKAGEVQTDKHLIVQGRTVDNIPSLTASLAAVFPARR